jgi:hypothetical protein
MPRRLVSAQICVVLIRLCAELLHLVQWHAGVQQEGRHAGAQPVRGDLLIDTRPPRGALH